MVLAVAVLGTGLIILGIWLCAHPGVYHRGLSDEQPDFGNGVLSLFAGVVLFLPGVIVYAVTLNEAASMEAFHDANKQNMVFTMNRTEEVLSPYMDRGGEPSAVGAGMLGIDLGLAIEGSIEKVKYAEHVAERIKETRRAVVGYNSKLERNRRMSRSFLAWPFFNCPADHLEPFILGQ